MAATNAQMATWLIANKDKKGTADFETVARHYTANMGAAPTPAATSETPRRKNGQAYWVVRWTSDKVCTKCQRQSLPA